jgi:DEAD/DEAH box helicase domain-containing protein
LADYIVVDIETQHLADEVGGWGNLEALRVSVALTWDEDAGYRTWWEGQAGDLLAELGRSKLVVGYNVSAFDYAVLSLYGRVDDLAERTFDILDEIFQQCGRRVGLNVVAHLNLGEAKAYESGADAVKLWRDGRLDDLAAYCLKDVELTKRLYEMWEEQGILWISGTDFAIWPGPVTAQERKEEAQRGHDLSAFKRPRRGDPGRHG